jgi:hypothetical protein
MQEMNLAEGPLDISLKQEFEQCDCLPPNETSSAKQGLFTVLAKPGEREQRSD